MNKFVVAFFSLLGMIFSGIAWADGPVVMGYTDDHGNPVTGATEVTCIPGSGGVTVTLHQIVLIRDLDDGPKGKFTPNTLYSNPVTKAQAYRVFERSSGTAYATATGPKGWKLGSGVLLDGIKIKSDSYIASSRVSNGSVTFHLKGAPAGSFYAFNGVHVSSDGTNSWLGVEGTRYTVHNVNGKPLLVVGAGCETAPLTLVEQFKSWQ